MQLKQLPFIDTFERALKSVYSFYQRSPKRLRNFQAIASALEEQTHCPDGIFVVQWVASKLRAIQAMEKNQLLVVVHLKEVGSGTDEEAAKPKGILKHQN